MKKWAKVLLAIGIVWLFCAVYFYFDACVNVMIDCASPPCIRPSCFRWDGALGILILGIPSWIMFLVVGIFGRTRKKK